MLHCALVNRTKNMCVNKKQSVVQHYQMGECTSYQAPDPCARYKAWTGREDVHIIVRHVFRSPRTNCILSSSSPRPPTSRLGPPILLAYLELNQYTSVCSSTIFHQPLTPSSGPVRFSKGARSARKPSPYPREVKSQIPTASSSSTDTAGEDGSISNQPRRAWQKGGEDDDDGVGLLLIPKPPDKNGRRNWGGYALSGKVRYRSGVWEEIEVCLEYSMAGPPLVLIFLRRNS